MSDAYISKIENKSEMIGNYFDSTSAVFFCQVEDASFEIDTATVRIYRGSISTLVDATVSKADGIALNKGCNVSFNIPVSFAQYEYEITKISFILTATVWGVSHSTEAAYYTPDSSLFLRNFLKITPTNFQVKAYPTAHANILVDKFNYNKGGFESTWDSIDTNATYLLHGKTVKIKYIQLWCSTDNLDWRILDQESVDNNNGRLTWSYANFPNAEDTVVYFKLEYLTEWQNRFNEYGFYTSNVFAIYRVEEVEKYNFQLSANQGELHPFLTNSNLSLKAGFSNDYKDYLNLNLSKLGKLELTIFNETEPLIVLEDYTLGGRYFRISFLNSEGEYPIKYQCIYSTGEQVNSSGEAILDENGNKIFDGSPYNYVLQQNEWIITFNDKVIEIINLILQEKYNKTNLNTLKTGVQFVLYSTDIFEREIISNKFDWSNLITIREPISWELDLNLKDIAVYGVLGNQIVFLEEDINDDIIINPKEVLRCLLSDFKNNYPIDPSFAVIDTTKNQFEYGIENYTYSLIGYYGNTKASLNHSFSVDLKLKSTNDEYYLEFVPYDIIEWNDTSYMNFKIVVKDSQTSLSDSIVFSPILRLGRVQGMVANYCKISGDGKTMEFRLFDNGGDQNENQNYESFAKSWSGEKQIYHRTSLSRTGNECLILNFLNTNGGILQTLPFAVGVNNFTIEMLRDLLIPQYKRELDVEELLSGIENLNEIKKIQGLFYFSDLSPIQTLSMEAQYEQGYIEFEIEVIVDTLKPTVGYRKNGLIINGAPGSQLKGNDFIEINALSLDKTISINYLDETGTIACTGQIYCDYSDPDNKIICLKGFKIV